MNTYLANKTLIAFENAVKVDQGATYRGWLKKVLPHIGDAYREEEEDFRTHLGASVLGNDCERAIWYGFRWATVRKFSGRMLRLFNRGHIEEGRLIALLLTIGCEVIQQDNEGNQFRISFADGHGGGSGDGLIVNVPDIAPGQRLLGEFKTHNNKSFTKLAGDNWKDYVEALVDPSKPRQDFLGEGVRQAKYEHYVQAQTYMRRMGVGAALYVAVNKDDDSIYAEILPLNTEAGDYFMDRGQRIIYSDDPPDKINKSPGFFKCKFCDHSGVCHRKVMPARNCRTCIFASPLKDGWHCRKHQQLLTKEDQLAGCTEYKPHKVFG